MEHLADLGRSRVLLHSTALHPTLFCFYKCILTLPSIILSAYWVICGCTALRWPCLCIVSGRLCLVACMQSCSGLMCVFCSVALIGCTRCFVSHLYICKSKTVPYVRQWTTALLCIITATQYALIPPELCSCHKQNTC